MASELRKGSLVRYNRPGIFQKRASLDVILKEPVKLEISVLRKIFSNLGD